MITTTELTEREYKQYKPVNNNAVEFWQKAFKDENGRKKYFINLYKYEYKVENSYVISWEAENQFDNEDGVFNVCLLNADEHSKIETETAIDKIERFFNNIFERLECFDYGY